jgi:hypothetical protein
MDKKQLTEADKAQLDNFIDPESTSERQNRVTAARSGAAGRARNRWMVPLRVYRQIANGLLGGLVRPFTTMFVKPCAFSFCPTSGVLDFSGPCGRIATPDR